MRLTANAIVVPVCANLLPFEVQGVNMIDLAICCLWKQDPVPKGKDARTRVFVGGLDVAPP